MSTRRKTITCLLLGAPGTNLRVVGLMNTINGQLALKSVHIYESQAEAMKALANNRQIGRYLMGRTDDKAVRPLKHTELLTIKTITGATADGENVYGEVPFRKFMQFWPETADILGHRPECIKKLRWLAAEVFEHGVQSVDTRCILQGWKPMLMWQVQVTAQIQGERWDTELQAKATKTFEYIHTLQAKDLAELKTKVTDCRKKIKAKGGRLLPVAKDAYALRWVPVSRKKAEIEEAKPVAPNGAVPAIA